MQRLQSWRPLAQTLLCPYGLSDGLSLPSRSSFCKSCCHSCKSKGRDFPSRFWLSMPRSRTRSCCKLRGVGRSLTRWSTQMIFPARSLAASQTRRTTGLQTKTKSRLRCKQAVRQRCYTDVFLVPPSLYSRAKQRARRGAKAMTSAYVCNVVIDLEFTPVPKCLRKGTGLRQEIIEIGAVKLDSKGNVVGEFSHTVRPTLAKGVSGTVRNLTGIVNSEIACARTLPDVLDALAAWIGPGRVRMVTWSDSDLKQIRGDAWQRASSRGCPQGGWIFSGSTGTLWIWAEEGRSARPPTGLALPTTRILRIEPCTTHR